MIARIYHISCPLLAPLRHLQAAKRSGFRTTATSRN